MTFSGSLATSALSADDEEYTAVLGPQGRIVIPIEIRKKLGLEPGTVINIWTEDGKVHLRSRAAARAAAKKLFTDARARLGGGSLVDELLAERRAEATRELADEN
ncbi:MAG TPA: AbrB/MazE/SpoVT family DNA-binding domain-containing protein [Lacisediminihabitans sp.]|jgi:AbrB family looped-hinge helix DNA binding protein|nr:AbrB/MazE/SpoVT family DNA-binding domain-containing protein [Lacisediminihabitans sp.]HXD61683.1 AbrB/MazE/SpoVT family DNA-binding domain-containing protein [Lacisediminihabitans sp.]